MILSAFKRSLVRQKVLTDTCTKVASGLANVAGIAASTCMSINFQRERFRAAFACPVRVSFINSYVLSVMPAILVRPLATFVHVSESTLCRTRLRMFTELAVIRDMP